MAEKNTLGVPGPPTQCSEALEEGRTLAATVSVTLTRGQLRALEGAAHDRLTNRCLAHDEYAQLLGARGILRAHLRGEGV